jgi:hypothetical protein
MSSIKNDMAGLKRLLATLEKGKASKVQVGIFGHRAARSDKKGHLTNADLGFIHELGSPTMGIPPRSFLRMPINLKGKEIYAKAFKDTVHKLAATSEAWSELLNNIGRSATDVIQQAFGSRGFGSWAPDKPGTVKAKGSDMPLIDTGHLRRSILWRVV